MPPPPPGAIDILGWMFWLVLVGLLVAGIVVVARYVMRDMGTGSNYAATSRNEGLETAIKELLEEIRLLRKEIERLRKELHE